MATSSAATVCALGQGVLSAESVLPCIGDKADPLCKWVPLKPASVQALVPSVNLDSLSSSVGDDSVLRSGAGVDISLYSVQANLGNSTLQSKGSKVNLETACITGKSDGAGSSNSVMPSFGSSILHSNLAVDSISLLSTNFSSFEPPVVNLDRDFGAGEACSAKSVLPCSSMMHSRYLTEGMVTTLVNENGGDKGIAGEGLLCDQLDGAVFGGAEGLGPDMVSRYGEVSYGFAEESTAKAVSVSEVVDVVKAVDPNDAVCKNGQMIDCSVLKSRGKAGSSVQSMVKMASLSNVSNLSKVPCFGEKDVPSFVNVVNGFNGGDNLNPASKPVSLQFVQPKIGDGRVKVSPPLEVAEEGSVFWHCTLVGYFVGKRLPFLVVNSIAHKLWGKFGLREVLTSDNGFFLFKFASF